MILKKDRTALSVLEQAVERSTGESVSTLRTRSVEETRHLVEQKQGRLTRFLSFFPFIGRGHVLRDRLITHEEVERVFDSVVK